MDSFNRTMMIILSIAIVAAGVIVLLVIFGADSVLSMFPQGWMHDYVSRLTDLSGTPRTLAIGYTIVAVAAGLLLLLFELATMRRPERTLRVASDERGSMAIDERSVKQLVDAVSREVHGVRDTRSDIKERSGALRITVWPIVALGINVPNATNEIQGRVKEAVETLIGVPVSDVVVKAKYQQTRERGLAPQ
jgi:hypothetical protein